MNMTWFPRTTKLCCATGGMRAFTLGTAIATAACLTVGNDVSAQQYARQSQNGPHVRSVQHDGKSFPVVQASESMTYRAPTTASPARAPAKNGSARTIPTTAPDGIEQIDHQSASSCDSGLSGPLRRGMGGSMSERMFGNLSGRGSGGHAGSGGDCNSGSCNTGGSGCYTGGGIGGYGGGGTGGGAYGNGSQCPTCAPFRYARIEGVYMRRNGLDNFTRSRNFALDDPDFDWAPRITIGSVPDCSNGYEASFVGPLRWNTSENLLNPNGSTLLEELFTPQPGVAVNEVQSYRSEYWSGEASKTMMAWDIAKFYFGGRYINFDEDYLYSASRGAIAAVPAAGGNPAVPAVPAQSGSIASRTQNDLFGLQIGMEVFTPIFCENLSTFTRAKAGVYYNQADSRVTLLDQGARVYQYNDDDGGIAGMFEVSSGVQYQMGEMLSLHAGSELWYLTGVATAKDNIPPIAGIRTASPSTNADDDIVFVGFNFGATFKF